MPERPPKEWFYYVVGELEKNPDVKNPKRLAGWLWHHFMKPATKKAILKGERLDPLKVRKQLIAKPKVEAFTDHKASGLVRILERQDGTLYPEFALYPKSNRKLITESLRDAGLTEESRGKWVLRTNKFSIFVYI